MMLLANLVRPACGTGVSPVNHAQDARATIEQTSTRAEE